MRVALLTQSYPPMISGAALVVQRLAQGLAQRGHSVLVLAASDKGTAYTQTDGTLTVARLKAWPNPLRKGQHFLLWPQTAMAQALSGFQPQIIHTHDALVTSLVGLRAAQSLNKPVPWVLTVHQLPWFVSLLAPPLLRQPIEAGLWAYGRWLYKRFDTIVTPSQMIADVVAAHGAKRPDVVSNGVDTERFRPEGTVPDEAAALRQKYGLDPYLPIVLYAGRLDVDKRVDLVVRALAKARETVPAQLLLVGDGKQRERLVGLSTTLGLSGSIHFTGFVPSPGDLAGLYRLGAVFVTASSVEIQSSVVLEAAASGLPVVTVRASSMPEFVEEGVTGHLVVANDEAQLMRNLAQRISALLSDPQQAQRLGQAGRKLAERHSQRAMLEGYEALYAKLLS